MLFMLFFINARKGGSIFLALKGNYLKSFCIFAA